MDKIKANLNWIIGILTVLFVGFIVYNSFIKKDESSNVEEITVGNTDSDTREIIGVLEKIEKLTIDKRFFTERISDEGYVPSFNDLIDYQTKGIEERPGKANPFVVGAGIVYNDVQENNDNQEDQNQTVVEESAQPNNGGVQEKLVDTNSQETNNNSQ